jgi:hypothetical protein
MHQFFSKHIEMRERWFAACLFPFKLLTVSTVVLLLIWYVLLPQDHSNAYTGIDWRWYWASYDFFIMAQFARLFFYLAAAVLTGGGMIQLVRHSFHAATWSIAFGFFALVVGIVLAVFVSPPNGFIEVLRSAA